MKSASQNHRQAVPRDIQQGSQLRRPLVFHQPAQALKARLGIGGVHPRPCLGARGGSVEQGPDLLVTEAGAAIPRHVAAYDTFGQTRAYPPIGWSPAFDRSLSREKGPGVARRGSQVRFWSRLRGPHSEGPLEALL